MRALLVPLLFGCLGAFGFGLGLMLESMAILAYPGSMLSFALIHGSEGSISPIIAVGAGALVHAALFAFFGSVLFLALRGLR